MIPYESACFRLNLFRWLIISAYAEAYGEPVDGE